MLKIQDLAVSKELAREEMAGVVGGTTELERLSALIDFSTGLVNKVADVEQAFGLNLAQGNTGAVTNNQNIIGGNGIVFAPVTQSQVQSNAMAVADLGNVAVS